MCATWWRLTAPPRWHRPRAWLVLQRWPSWPSLSPALRPGRRLRPCWRIPARTPPRQAVASGCSEVAERQAPGRGRCALLRATTKPTYRQQRHRSGRRSRPRQQGRAGSGESRSLRSLLASCVVAWGHRVHRRNPRHPNKGSAHPGGGIRSSSAGAALRRTCLQAWSWRCLACRRGGPAVHR